MPRFLAAFVLVLAPGGPSVEDGRAWLARAEEQLYRWPAPPARISFEVQTDVLAPMIAAWKRDLGQEPDAEAARLVSALERAQLRGTIDTATGKLESEVAIDYRSSDLRTQKAIDTLAQRLRTSLSSCFSGLPLSDPRLVSAGASVLGAEERAGERVVTAECGRRGERCVLHFARDTGLPRLLERPQLALELEYCQATPGRFVPARIDARPKGAPATRAEIRWGRAGDYWFPEHVRLCTKDSAASFEFERLRVEPRPR